MSDYSMWKSYETAAPAELTEETLRAAFDAVYDQGREPYIDIVSPAHYAWLVQHYSKEPPMSKLQAFIARAKVVFNAAPTYLVAASAIAIIVSDEVSTVLPAGAATVVAAVTLKVVAVLGAAVSIIRRVKPVLPSERGIL